MVWFLGGPIVSLGEIQGPTRSSSTSRDAWFMYFLLEPNPILQLLKAIQASGRKLCAGAQCKFD